MRLRLLIEGYKGNNCHYGVDTDVMRKLKCKADNIDKLIKMRKKITIGIILTSIIIITMGFFDIFSAKQNLDTKFVTEDSYKKNRDNQIYMAPQTLKQLRDLGVTETKELKLEYFFYTITTDKAKSLADEIQKKDYTVKYGKSGGDKNLFVITGWTSKMAMSDSTVIEWSKQMCELGLKFDCEFDGWGTEPEQK